jgi:large subunit ribosomal protein L30
VPSKKQAAEPGLVRITQIRSEIGRPGVHKRTLRALGLKYQRSVVQKDNEAIRGMIFQVKHLVSVEDLPQGEA